MGLFSWFFTWFLLKQAAAVMVVDDDANSHRAAPLRGLLRGANGENLSTVASKKDNTSRRQFTTMNHNKDDVYTDYFPVYKCSGVTRYANDDAQYRCTLSMILLYQGQVVPLNGKTETDLASFFGETYGQAGNACAEHVTVLQQMQPF